MNRIVRSIIVPTLAVFGGLVALPSVASAQEQHRGDERAMHERERLERERHERLERERLERARIEREREVRAREHQIACVRASEHGASNHRLREMGCWVR